MTGIDMLSAMLIATEIVDVKRFCTPWKLVSYAGLAPSTRESSGKTRTGRISKQGCPWLRWILVQSAMTAVRYDQRLKSFYERLKSRKGSAKASYNQRNSCYNVVHADKKMSWTPLN
jgi:transposase